MKQLLFIFLVLVLVGCKDDLDGEYVARSMPNHKLILLKSSAYNYLIDGEIVNTGLWQVLKKGQVTFYDWIYFNHCQYSVGKSSRLSVLCGRNKIIFHPDLPECDFVRN